MKLLKSISLKTFNPSMIPKLMIPPIKAKIPIPSRPSQAQLNPKSQLNLALPPLDSLNNKKKINLNPQNPKKSRPSKSSPSPPLEVISKNPSPKSNTPLPTNNNHPSCPRNPRNPSNFL